MAIKFDRKIFDDLLNDPKKGTFTIAGGTAVLVIVMLVVAIRPAVASVIEQISSNETRRELIQDQERKIETLTGENGLLERRERYSDEIELFYESLPNFDDVEFLINNIHSFVAENDGIAFNTLETDYSRVGNVAQGDLSTLELELGFSVDPGEVNELLVYLESFPRVLNIKSISILPEIGTEGENTGNSRVTVNLEVYNLTSLE